jgi:hypothetical protein
VIVLVHFHAKHFAEFAGFAPQPNAMPRRGCLYDFKSVCPRETFDLRQVICVGAMLRLEFFAGKMMAIARKQIRKRLVRVQLRRRPPRSNDNGDGNFLVRISWSDDTRPSYRDIFASVDRDMRIARSHRWSSVACG